MRPRHATASTLPAGQAGGSAFASTLSGRGSEPSTPVASAARKQTPFASTPPTSAAREEAAPATSPSLERLMSGAQRMSPAVIAQAKAHAATQLEFNSQRSDSAMLHGAPARVSPKKRTQVTQQQQQKQPQPGKSLDERLGRMPAGQPTHNVRKAAVDRSQTAGVRALQRPPRRIKPSELSPAAVSPPPVQHAASRQWPLPGPHAVSTAWSPEPGSRSVASGSQTVPPLAFGTMPPATVRAALPVAHVDEPLAAQRSALAAQPPAASSTGGNTASSSRNSKPGVCAVSGVAAPAVLEPNVRLQWAHRLGTLYGHPLRRCTGMALAPELDLLLQLMLLPAGLEVAADQAPNALLNSTAAAAAFAATALMQAGDQGSTAELRVALQP